MTDNLKMKATMLLVEGRVQVVWATDQIIQAKVRGDHGLYEVRWSRAMGWSCDCPAFSDCSHRESVSRVTMRSVKAGVSV